MTEHVHDCVIVGAGPAGAAAALQMAREGLDVVLLERGDRPGEKNVMSGVLYTDKLHTLIPDFRQRAPLQRCVVGYEMYLLGEGEVLRLPTVRDYRRSEHPHPPITVFRSQFDAWFAAEAVDAGAELFTATLVEDLLWEDGRVAGVRTRRGDLRARVVLGADGVNSTVAEKSGLVAPPSPAQVSLIVRQILDLSAERIEERFNLQPGEGVCSLYIGRVPGLTSGIGGAYYTELYTNQDSLSMTLEVPLNVLQACGVPNYEVLAARERHPHIARLIQGATLREYQAHLIPWGGVGDLGCLYGDGVLLAGDAGRFTTKSGVGAWPAMASGAAAARTVRRACEMGNFSRDALAVYREFLDEEGLLATQREARRDWESRGPERELWAHADRIFSVVNRYSTAWPPGQQYPHSLWGEVYYSLVKPLAPWYVRWPLGLAAWLDTRRWRKGQARK